MTVLHDHGSEENLDIQQNPADNSTPDLSAALIRSFNQGRRVEILKDGEVIGAFLPSFDAVIPCVYNALENSLFVTENQVLEENIGLYETLIDGDVNFWVMRDHDPREVVALLVCKDTLDTLKRAEIKQQGGLTVVVSNGLRIDG